MGYNPPEHVCEWYDFECMCKNDRNVYRKLIWSNVTSKICHWSQNNEKNKLFCSFLIVKYKNLKSVGVLYPEPTGGLLTLDRIFSPSIILKSPPIKMCSENTDSLGTKDSHTEFIGSHIHFV